MNCDRIARAYRWLEYLAFGRELERRRLCYLTRAAGARRALILGDGDGRFLSELAAASDTCIDYVDASARMLELARARAGAVHVKYHHADALVIPLAPSTYDLVVTHFFLDCFDAVDLERLVDRVHTAAAPGAWWLISEFRQPAWARPLLAAMYLFFRVATGLSNRKLVDHRPLLERCGFRLRCEETSRGGWIASELWQRSE